MSKLNQVENKVFSKTSSKSNVLVPDIKNKLLTDNYIYISHIDSSWCPSGLNAEPQFWKLPSYPDQISDSMSSRFSETTALGRTAPVYTYSYSGPRSVQVAFSFHRDMMNDMNLGISNSTLYDGEDYVDNLIRALQSIAVPNFNITNRAIEPPIVALRLAREIFIKGVVTSGIGLTFQKPILDDERYAQVSLSLTISEMDPYDAESVYKNGGFRGMVSTFKKINDTKTRMGDW